MKIRTLFYSMLIIGLLLRCGVTKKYEEARASKSIQLYETYIVKYPKSKYLSKAKDELASLYEERDWSLAKSSNTINGYKKFLLDYTNSKYTSQVEIKIKELEEEANWNTTKNINSVYAYENYLFSFPESKYVFEAKNKIQQIKDDLAWKEADTQATSESYQKYISNFPSGTKKTQALERIQEIKIIQPKWENVIKKNTPDGYRTFLNQYYSSSYSTKARQKLSELEEKFWSEALTGKSLKKYQNYISNFPDGKYYDEAEKAIIDIEVDNIFKGDHGVLPPMSKTSGRYYNVNTNEIEIYNKTSYILSVRYSGSFESKKIVLSPNQKQKFTIRNGDYKVAASVNATNVRNYAGKEKLEGGSYTSEFYIETKTIWDR